MKGAMRTALLIGTIYVVIGGLWIYYSDTALEAMVADLATMRLLQTWKGWAFVLVTGMLVFWMSWWALSRQNALIVRLHRLAYFHPLTGLPSRSATQSRVDQAMEQADGVGLGVAVVQIDLDGFGIINDSFGHELGDELLCKVADELQRCLGEQGWLGHIGADEYIIVFAGVVSRKQLNEGIELVSGALARPFSVGGVSKVHVSASMGVSLYPEDATSASQLLRFSDAALARAKHKGPGTIERFKASMVEQARRRLNVDARLRAALDSDELALHFQPIHKSGDDSRLVGAEALLRWLPPDEPPMSPAEFIPIAEQSGLILDLGAWVIEQACTQIARWKAAGLSPPQVSINLSIRQFMSPGLVEQLTGALDRHGLSSSSLVLEMTESLLMEQGSSGRNILESLRAEGFRIALDDFGTGYSSLAYLRELPIDLIKIDRSFVGSLERSQADRDLVAAMISLSDIFGLRVVAEGVETLAQRRILEQLGCHSFQGFLFSKPMPAKDFWSMLANEASTSPVQAGQH
jgi:diguanylate cyclase (GGDEF)-like protein